MVFSNLQPHEKDAFFSLLDEYFSSRPEILAGLAGAEKSDAFASSSTPAQFVGRAMASNPEATSKFMSAGMKHVASMRNADLGSSGQSDGTQGGSDNEVTSVAGRVAAAQAALAASRNNSSVSPPPIAEKRQSNLVSVKTFGSTVDTSSAKGFIGSLRSNKSSSPPQANIPPAFAPRQNSFAPPPRRTASGSSEAAAAPPPPAPRRTPAAPPPPPEPEPDPEEEAGEWAEALYEYDSGEAGDLKITEGQRILVVERTSDDWWTGEVNGKRGLFPASYVKVF